MMPTCLLQTLHSDILMLTYYHCRILSDLIYIFLPNITTEDCSLIFLISSIIIIEESLICYSFSYPQSPPKTILIFLVFPGIITEDSLFWYSQFYLISSSILYPGILILTQYHHKRLKSDIHILTHYHHWRLYHAILNLT